MDARRQAAIVTGQFKFAVKQPHEYLKFMMDEKDYNKWYILLSGFDGDEGEYTDGEYLVRIKLPADFPYNPPEFYFMTEQGLYGVETKVCISIGEFHKADARAALKVGEFCTQLISGLIGWRDMGGGIQILQTDVKQKKRFAANSRAYNAKYNSDICNKINETYAGYSTNWDLKTVPLEIQKKLSLGKFGLKFETKTEENLAMDVECGVGVGTENNTMDVEEKQPITLDIVSDLTVDLKNLNVNDQ